MSSGDSLITQNVRFFEHKPVGIQKFAYNDSSNRLAVLRFVLNLVIPMSKYNDIDSY